MKKMSPLNFVFAKTLPLACCVVLLIHGDASRADQQPLSFNRDIRPILSENCFQCHGPDEETREAELRLDTFAGATEDRGGSVAITAGDPAASDVMDRITTADEDLRMPPASTGKRLSKQQIDLLQRWIAQGATYQKHWSFEPVVRWPLPDVRDTQWPTNAIDYFVLAKLEANGLSPSPEADRYTLIRRVYLDFLGLPPAVEAVDAFVNDHRPDAYQRMVDRVLASPRFGERWGRHWLDQARYADSHGYTNDNERVMWPYRDWVIDALNRDLPFDQFTLEQLAGDLLPNPSVNQLVATGFHRNTLINSEGGTKADQFRDEQVKDRVDTTGGVWLGLTVGCAKCHTHKFDPISQTEYYQLYGFFNSTADNNSITPTIKAPTPRQQLQIARLEARRKELQQALAGDAQRAPRQRNWETALIEAAKREAGDDQKPAMPWTVLELDGKTEQGAELVRLDDHSLLASGVNEPKEEYKMTALSPLTKIRSVRVEVLKHESLPQGGPGRAGNGNFVLSEFWFRTGDGRELRFAKAAADHSQPRYDVAGAIDGKSNTGWAINNSPEGGANHNRLAWFVLPTPLEVEQGHALTFTMQFDNGSSAYNIGRLRLSVSPDEWVDAPSVNDLAKLAAIPPADRTDAQSKRLNEAFLRSDERLGPVFGELQSVIKQQEELEGQIPSTMIMRELDSPRKTYLQVRGDFLRTDAEVAADVPAVLPPLAESESRRTRVELSQWLTSPENPLTPRVRVNRIWMRLFGLGLVETENDFGTQGTLPTHPELLDWLASEFVRQQWSTKQLLRTIVHSSTYRQASHNRPDLDASDPRNQWLGRQNRVRVEGEIVRDLGLAVSGLLSHKIGGPSVHPPQPDGVYDFTQRRKNWNVSEGEDRYRRGMYTFFYRSAPYPMLTTFDAPKFNQTCTRRTRSNTPLQSLTVANDEAIFEMARNLAAQIQSRSEPTANLTEKLTRMFRRCFARPPSDAESKFLTDFYQSQKRHFEDNPAAASALMANSPAAAENAPDSAAWLATARVLLNLDEFVTRE